METTVFWVFAIITILLFLFLLVEFYAYTNETVKFNVACAGSEKPFTPQALNVTNLRWDNFKDKNGNKLNKKDFIKFIIKGDSMLLGGIKNNDLVFVRKIKDKTALQFPSIMALKRDKNALQKAAQFNDKATIKIRRTWRICTLDKSDEEIENILSEIINSQEFNNLKRIDESKFPEAECLVSDFKEKRLKRYREEHEGCNRTDSKDNNAIISTTLDTRTGKVHFSIHPFYSIIGKVEYAFSISNSEA